MSIAFGVCVGPSGKFDSLAVGGITGVAPGSLVFTRRDQSSIFDAYNSMIDEALRNDVDALVLLHDDVLLRDADTLDKLTPLVADPTVGLVGVIGARNPRSVEWWWYDTRGMVQENGRLVDFTRGTFDVDVVDGLFLVLTRASMTTLRFDAHTFSGFHAYDTDFAMQCRAAGLRVVVTDIDLYHDATPGRITNRRAYFEADRKWRGKWRPTLRDKVRLTSFLLTSSRLTWRERVLKLSGRIGVVLLNARHEDPPSSDPDN